MPVTQDLLEAIDTAPPGVVQAQALRIVALNAVHGDALTDRIVRALLATNGSPDVAAPAGPPPPDAVEILHQIHMRQYLTRVGSEDDPDVTDSDAEDLHDRIGMALIEWRRDRGGRAARGVPPPPPRSTPAPAPAVSPPDPFERLFKTPDEPEPTITVAEPDANTLRVGPAVLHEDERYRLTRGEIVHALDKSDGSSHVYAAGTALCLIHGSQCPYALAQLGGKES